MATVLTAPVLRKEIRRILKGEDLEKMTPKIVRLRLEQKYTVDLVDRKQEISQVCKQVIDALSESSESEEEEDAVEAVVPTPDGNVVDGEKEGKESSGTDSDTSSNSGSDSDTETRKKVNGSSKLTNSTSSSSSAPPKKKQKSKPVPERVSSPEITGPNSDSDDDKDDPEALVSDEELARRLQEQERPIRKAARHLVNKEHTKPGKEKPTKEKKKGTGGYMKDMKLSDELASLFGTDRMPRHEVVKRMHALIKERGLQDPRNKQYHLCDDDLLPIFGKKRVKTFGMMKYLNKHIMLDE